MPSSHISRTSYGLRATRITQNKQNHKVPKRALCAHRGRNLGPSEHVSMPTVCQSGKKDLLNRMRWEGRSFSVLQRVLVLVQRYNAVLL